MKHRIMILAGGTGGHISPGVAIAEVYKEKLESWDVDYIGIYSLSRNRNNPDFKEVGVEVLFHNLPQLKLKYILFYPFLFFWDLIFTFFLFYRKDISMVIGMGGYSSFPGILFAILFKKKLCLCEQNVIPGKVTRMFAKKAEKIALSFPVQEKVLERSKVLGNPIRKKVLPEKIHKKTLIGKKEDFNVLVLGGSQGARQLNQIVLNAMNDPNLPSRVRFKLLTGSSLFEETKKLAKNDTSLMSYDHDMRPHYEWAHLVFSRSGAGVVAESLLFGVPMLLIPYPYAADNHQLANAEYLKSIGACEVLNTTSMESKPLVDFLKKIQEQPEIWERMAESAMQNAQWNASHQTAYYFLSK